MVKVTVSFDMRSPAFGAPTNELYAAALEMAAFADEIGVDRIGLMEHHGSDDGYLPQPFVLAGIGATFFGADEPEDETKLAPLLAAGLKWFPYGSGWGVRVEARYSPTHLDDSGSDFCDPFGFCQSWLQQFQFLGGVTLRF